MAYRQQSSMFRGEPVPSAERILSVHQPHIRAIKRGKTAGRDYEFGPKLHASMHDGFAGLELTSFNGFHEAGDLPAAVERYCANTGHYPALVLGGGIYFTRANRKFLAARLIGHNGARLGPKKELSKAERAKDKRQHADRQAIEGKFGELKTRYGLGRLSARNPHGQLAEIALKFLAANAALALRALTLALMVVLSCWEAFFEAFRQGHSGVGATSNRLRTLRLRTTADFLSLSV